MAQTKPSRFIECGRIINTHGCRGEVKAEPWMDAPHDLIDLGRVFIGEGEDKQEVKITRGAVMQGRFLLLGLAGVSTMDDADRLRGTVLYAAREDFHLEDGQYFLSDVLGLTVLDARTGREGNTLGVVEDILPGAASQIYSVKTPQGTEVLVPAVPAFITEVKVGEYVRMTPIDGMFEDSDADSKKESDSTKESD